MPPEKKSDSLLLNLPDELLILVMRFLSDGSLASCAPACSTIARISEAILHRSRKNLTRSIIWAVSTRNDSKLKREVEKICDGRYRPEKTASTVDALLKHAIDVQHDAAVAVLAEKHRLCHLLTSPEAPLRQLRAALHLKYYFGIQSLLREPSDIVRVDAYGCNIFHYLASISTPSRRCIATMEQFYLLGPSAVTKANKKGLLPLHVAARYQAIHSFKWLLPLSDPNSTMEGQRLSFTLAHKLREGKESIYASALKHLILDERTNVNDRDSHGNTIGHLLAKCHSRQPLQALLQREDFDPNVTDVDGETMLHIAARSKNCQNIRLLCADKRVNVNARDAREETALLSVARFGFLRNMETLLSRSDPSVTDLDGRTALHLLILWYESACNEGTRSSKIVVEDATLARLCTEGSCEVLDKNNFSALHYAARCGWPRAAKRICKQAPGMLHIRSNEGKTPLHYATAAGCKEALACLIRPQSAHHLNDGDKDGSTALHIAANGVWVVGIRALLKAGANADAMDGNRSTPLHVLASTPSSKDSWRERDVKMCIQLLSATSAGLHRTAAPDPTTLDIPSVAFAENHVALPEQHKEGVQLWMEKGENDRHVDNKRRRPSGHVERSPAGRHLMVRARKDLACDALKLGRLPIVLHS